MHSSLNLQLPSLRKHTVGGAEVEEDRVPDVYR